MFNILTAATGLALFLFAMVRLTETVRRAVTSTRIRELFRYAVRTPLWGLVTGIVITVLFQSSSATTVLAVGLVSAGLISFFHSLGVILGADIGTTLTVQLVVWRVTDLSPLLVIFGALLWVAGKGKYKAIGESIFYFGLMFFGLSIVAHATEPLKEAAYFISFFRETTNPFLGVLIGCVFTALVQSSAIPIALLVILAGHDLLVIEEAVSFVLGANLGTAGTAIIAAMAANIEGKRVAFSHALFKCTGVIVCLLALTPFVTLLKAASASVPQQIALAHILFNLLVAVIFVPILPYFARFAVMIFPERGEIFSIWPDFLDERLLGNAEIALEASRKEMEREMILARRMCFLSMSLVSRFNSGDMQTIGYIEDVVNSLKEQIGIFLRRISELNLSRATSKQLFLFSALVDDIERIADHATNISELAEIKAKRNILFSEYAKKDLAEIQALIDANLDDAMLLMGTYSEKTIEGIFNREKMIDRLFVAAQLGHLERVQKKICHSDAGPIYVRILVNMERISDHCENIAEYFRDLNSVETEDEG
ncbi:MAG: Na/Pi cotransporter family protein [Syntrophales bacterium]|nr:Na/Pi cotransporter family protein [Syntrophales bacterium]